MAYNSYSWGKPAAPVPEVPLAPGPDPEHHSPQADPGFAAGFTPWANMSQAPDIPADVVNLHDEETTGIVGGGVTYTTPETHDYGMGVAPGLTVAEQQALRYSLMSEDTGEVVVRHYDPITDRDAQPEVQSTRDSRFDGDSPATNQYKQTGVGAPADPQGYARVGQRFKRVWDRIWDYHRFEVDMRPATVRNAYHAPDQPVVAHGSQYTSPFPSAAGSYGDFQSPDSFVTPVLRRTPEPWDVPMTEDVSGGNAMVWSP